MSHREGQWLASRRQLTGPFASWWLVGLWLALVVKLLGIQLGGIVTLGGLLLLSFWLPLFAVRSSRRRWTVRQIGRLWCQLVVLAVWWLPLGWFSYLPTVQASLKLPAVWQNWLFNTRYEWLPVVIPLWLFCWLASWKWLAGVTQFMAVPTGWRDFWHAGRQKHWWSVFKASFAKLLAIIGWLGLVVIGTGFVWLSGIAPLGNVGNQLVSRVLAIIVLAMGQAWWWHVLMGWWSIHWPDSKIPVRPKWQGRLLMLIGGLSLLGYAGWWLGTPPETTPAVIAHRGVNGHDGVQNTTAALRKTVKQTHPDMVEMDIQPTADLHWVVMHDPTLKALAGQAGTVRDYPVNDLSGLPLREHGQTGRLSTFKQYFAIAQQLHQPLLVEIKAVGPADQLMGPFADRYAQSLVRHQGAVHSLDYRVIERLHQRNTKLSVGFITPFYLTDFADSVANFYSLQALTATREQISAVHRHQQPVYFWTVDRSFDMQRLAAMGADGIITNRPGQLRRVQTDSSYYYFYQLINWFLEWL